MRRLIAAVVVLGLLVACSGSRAGSRAQEGPSPTGVSCSREIAEFVEALDDLDGRVEIGISMLDFVDAVVKLGETASDLDAAGAEDDCDSGVLDPALDAFRAFERARRTYKRCDYDCPPRVYRAIYLEWAKASIALRGLMERLAVAARRAVPPPEVCEPVAAARELAAGLQDGSIGTIEGATQAQDLQDVLLALKDDLDEIGRSHLEEEISAIVVALTDVSYQPEEPRTAQQLDFAVDDLGCPVEKEPTPIV